MHIINHPITLEFSGCKYLNLLTILTHLVLARVEEVHARVGADGPVGMLSAAVDASEGFPRMASKQQNSISHISVGSGTLTYNLEQNIAGNTSDPSSFAISTVKCLMEKHLQTQFGCLTVHDLHEAHLSAERTLGHPQKKG